MNNTAKLLNNKRRGYSAEILSLIDVYTAALGQYRRAIRERDDMLKLVNDNIAGCQESYDFAKGMVYAYRTILKTVYSHVKLARKYPR
jgi:hypothetical protein